MSTRVLSADLDWIVAFTNAYARVTRAANGEEGDPYPDVSVLGERPMAALSLSTRELARLADQLFEVFAAASDKERVEHLDALLSSSKPRPHLEHNGRQHVVYWEATDSQAAAEAACALSLVNLVVEEERSRAPVGTCQAATCEDVFVDRSHARSRRYCSTKCQTRTKVAAFRARHREEPT